jgi:hypothetical protein
MSNSTEDLTYHPRDFGCLARWICQGSRRYENAELANRVASDATSEDVAWCHALLCAAQIGPALAQFKLQEPFTGTTAPGWALSRIALLTAPSIDVDGHGWLRLTNTNNTTKGLALDTAQSFPGNVPVAVRFRYVAWGGTGAAALGAFGALGGDPQCQLLRLDQ